MHKKKITIGPRHRATTRNLSASLIILFFLFSTFSAAQDIKLSVSPSSGIILTGTSSLHNWESEVKEIQGDMIINKNLLTRVEKGATFKDINLRIKVESIESGRAGMDKRTREALKWKDHPEIIVSIPNARITKTEPDSSFMTQARGTLTVAGVSQPFEIEVAGKTERPGVFRFSGNHKILMRDFNIEPPTAMFGQIITGEEVEINFEFIMEKP